MKPNIKFLVAVVIVVGAISGIQGIQSITSLASVSPSTQHAGLFDFFFGAEPSSSPVPTASPGVTYTSSASRQCYALIDVKEVKSADGKVSYNVDGTPTITCDDLSADLFRYEYDVSSSPLIVTLRNSNGGEIKKWSYTSSRFYIVDPADPASIPPADAGKYGMQESNEGILSLIIPTSASASSLEIADTILNTTTKLSVSTNILKGVGAPSINFQIAPDRTLYVGQPYTITWYTSGNLEQGITKGQNGKPVVSVALMKDGKLDRYLNVGTSNATISDVLPTTVTPGTYTLRISALGAPYFYAETSPITIKDPSTAITAGPVKVQVTYEHTTSPALKMGTATVVLTNNADVALSNIGFEMSSSNDYNTIASGDSSGGGVPITSIPAHGTITLQVPVTFNSATNPATLSGFVEGNSVVIPSVTYNEEGKQKYPPDPVVPTITDTVVGTDSGRSALTGQKVTLVGILFAKAVTSDNNSNDIIFTSTRSAQYSYTVPKLVSTDGTHLDVTIPSDILPGYYSIAVKNYALNATSKPFTTFIVQSGNGIIASYKESDNSVTFTGALPTGSSQVGDYQVEVVSDTQGTLPWAPAPLRATGVVYQFSCNVNSGFVTVNLSRRPSLASLETVPVTSVRIFITPAGYKASQDRCKNPINPVLTSPSASPSVSPSGSPKVSVSPSASPSGKPPVTAPVITSVTPTSVTSGDSRLTVTGTGFALIGGNQGNTVMLKNISTGATFSIVQLFADSQNRIFAVIPTNSLLTGDYTVQVRNDQTGLSSDPFVSIHVYGYVPTPSVYINSGGSSSTASPSSTSSSSGSPSSFSGGHSFMATVFFTIGDFLDSIFR